MNVHVWVPDYASAIGGIQTLSRFLVRALRDIYPEARICVLSKNDTSFPEAAFDWSTTFTPLGWWPPGLRTAAFSAELFRRAALERPDLIITTHPNFTPVARWLQKAFRIPYMAVGNGIDVWQIHSSQMRSGLRHADALVAISEYTRQRMTDSVGVDANRISLFPCTVDADQFTRGPKPRFLQKRYGLRLDQPVILTITRLSSAERYKGYDQVLSALPAVRERSPNVRYILGGRGDDRPHVEAMVRELGISDNVILAGYIPQHELCAHYNLCDVFAMPSKGEGFGIVFLEALACGKPVLAGNKDGSVDAVLHGKVGALVDPDNLQEIEHALVQILSGTHPLEILRQPEELRRAVIEAYGYDRFKESVRKVVEPFVRVESR